MRRLFKSFCLAIITILLFWPLVSLAGSININSQFVHSELLIRYKDSQNVAKLSFHNRNEYKKAYINGKKNPRVELIEPNYTYKASLTPSDPYFSEQWSLPKIKAPEAWDTTQGSSEIVIAILDSGVDIDHPDLAENIWTNTLEMSGNGIDDDNNGYIDDISGWDFVSNVADPAPKFEGSWNEAGINHGTAVAGLASAVGNNGIGISGVSWHSKIMPIRVLDSQGIGDTLAVINGIQYAVQNGARIINLSFVGEGQSQLLKETIDNAVNRGVFVVAAAGNSNINLNNQPLYPVCYENVIGVAAVDSNDNKTDFSNYGSSCIDISAPGINLVSTVVYNPTYGLNNYYQSGWFGTSLSAPLVAASLSLIKSKNFLLSSHELENILKISSDSIETQNPSYQGQLGYGRVNLQNSLTSASLVAPDSIITGAGPGGGPHVRILDKDGKKISDFFAYAATFKGGVNVASGDVNGDGIDEIITGASSGGGPHVRILDKDGKKISDFFAYAATFKGGVNVATGDVDGDGSVEIITGAGKNGSPHVRIFNQVGQMKYQFFAYATTFRGGVNVAAGDVNGDGIDEIITGASSGGGPHVRIFNQSGQLISQFFAYAATFKGGVNVATGDVDGDGADEIITGAGPGGGPHVRVFNQGGQLINQFFAYAETFKGGVNVASGDVNGDGFDEIITGAGPGGGPHVRFFNKEGINQYQFFAYANTFKGGVSVANLKH